MGNKSGVQPSSAPDLKKMIHEDPELRDFFKLVKKFGFREQAFVRLDIAIERKKTAASADA